MKGRERSGRKRVKAFPLIYLQVSRDVQGLKMHTVKICTQYALNSKDLVTL